MCQILVSFIHYIFNPIGNFVFYMFNFLENLIQNQRHKMITTCVKYKTSYVFVLSHFHVPNITCIFFCFVLLHVVGAMKKSHNNLFFFAIFNLNRCVNRFIHKKSASKL